MPDETRPFEDESSARPQHAPGGEDSRREPMIGPASKRAAPQAPPTELLRQLVEATPKEQAGLRTLFDTLHRQMQTIETERRSAIAERDRLRARLRQQADKPPAASSGWTAWVLLVALVGGAGYVFAMPGLADSLRTQLRQQLASTFGLPQPAEIDETRIALPQSATQPAGAAPAATGVAAPATGAFPRDVANAAPQAVPPAAPQAAPATAAAPAEPSAAEKAAATQAAAAQANEAAQARVSALEGQIESLTKRLAERDNERSTLTTDIKAQQDRLSALEQKLQEQKLQAPPVPARNVAPVAEPTPAAAPQKPKAMPGPAALPLARAPAAPVGSRAQSSAQGAQARAGASNPSAADQSAAAQDKADVGAPVRLAPASGSLGTLPVEAVAKPGETVKVVNPGDPRRASREFLIYLSKPGDTLDSIARAFQVPVDRVIAANGAELADVNRPMGADEPVKIPNAVR